MTLFDSTRSDCSVSPTAASTMVETLTAIWQSVLHRSSIGIDDNFFNIGGNLRFADILFADIAQKCGRELPSATIFHAPTIVALASLLTQPTLPRFSPFVQLKAGYEKPPILIAHGLDGIASFSELAKHIRTGHPIYGIQAKGVDGMEDPFDRIEDMAQFYLDSLDELKPQGPYILIGYSSGGLVALEMARRLSEGGENVAGLVLVDAYPHPRFLSKDQRLWLIARRIRHHISEMKQMPTRDAISYFVRRLEHRLRMAGVHRRGTRLPEASRLSLARTTLRVKEKSYVALARYRPQFYPGKIKFVRAEINYFFPDDPTAVWGKLADDFEVEAVPGGHLDVVTSEFEGLAAALTRYVRGTLRQE
jgi:thioesterase domain-containing protein